MKRYIQKIKIISAVLIFLFLSSDAVSQYAYNKIVWADEFNYRGLPDSTKWSYDSGNGCPSNCGWGNNELQFYTSKRAENARAENGNLIIEARKEDYNAAKYTSARMN